MAEEEQAAPGYKGQLQDRHDDRAAAGRPDRRAEIAKYAEFFSFGTNDLTQTTFGFSRDDAEGKFLLRYVEEKILPENPFQVLDREGVGGLIKMAVEKARKTCGPTSRSVSAASTAVTRLYRVLPSGRA